MRNCPARGPAPQSTRSCTNFGADASLGRVARTSAALDRANKGTVFAIVGAAALAGGVVLYVTAPKRSRADRTVWLAPHAHATGGGIVLGGGF